MSTGKSHVIFNVQSLLKRVRSTSEHLENFQTKFDACKHQRRPLEFSEQIVCRQTSRAHTTYVAIVTTFVQYCTSYTIVSRPAFQSYNFVTSTPVLMSVRFNSEANKCKRTRSRTIQKYCLRYTIFSEPSPYCEAHTGPNQYGTGTRRYGSHEPSASAAS